MRIVSFLPAATEIAHALGAGDDLVGRSHECDFPADVRRLPIVSRPALSLDGLTQSAIDDAVAAHMRTGESLYVVDERLLNDLAPDVVLTQDLCQVCAPSGNELTRALASMPSRPSVVYLTPRTLAEIDENILAVGDAIGRTTEARALVDAIRARLDRLRDARRLVARPPRVSFLEWTDPLFCAGHWVPEMIGRAGGEDALGSVRTPSFRVQLQDVVEAEPDILLVAPCGYTAKQARDEYQSLELPEQWNAIPAVRNNRVYALEASSYFSRPGPRLVTGIEILAKVLQPCVTVSPEPKSAILPIPSRGAAARAASN